MNRDILLGVSFSLLLHFGVLWSGAYIHREAVGPKPFTAILDLAITGVSVSRQIPEEKGSVQQVPRKIHRPAPIPPRPRPHAELTKQMVARSLPQERVKRTEASVKVSAVIRKTPSSQDVPAPMPIRNARAILKEMNLESLLSERQRFLRPTPKPQSMPNTAVPLSRVSSAANRIGDNRLAPPTRDRESQTASTGASHSTSKEPSPEKDTGSGIKQKSYIPDPGSPQIIEAVPDYAINPKPAYPKRAIRRGYEGTVTLLAEVLPDGSVRDVEVFESSGHAILDRSALKAVRKWQFRPGTKGGKAVTIKVKVPVVFRLKRNVSG